MRKKKIIEERERGKNFKSRRSMFSSVAFKNLSSSDWLAGLSSHFCFSHLSSYFSFTFFHLQVHFHAPSDLSFSPPSLSFSFPHSIHIQVHNNHTHSLTNSFHSHLYNKFQSSTLLPFSLVSFFHSLQVSYIKNLVVLCRVFRVLDNIRITAIIIVFSFQNLCCIWGKTFLLFLTIPDSPSQTSNHSHCFSFKFHTFHIVVPIKVSQTIILIIIKKHDEKPQNIRVFPCSTCLDQGLCCSRWPCPILFLFRYRRSS